jgi:hypothetical protein
MWYPPLKSFIWIDLAHAQACTWLNKKSIKPQWFNLPQSSCIVFMPILILFCRKHDYDSYCSLVASQSFASLHLYREGLLLVHPTPKNQVSKESTINSYAWYFKAIPSKFSCAIFQNFQILLILCHCFWLMRT